MSQSSQCTSSHLISRAFMATSRASTNLTITLRSTTTTRTLTLISTTATGHWLKTSVPHLRSSREKSDELVSPLCHHRHHSRAKDVQSAWWTCKVLLRQRYLARHVAVRDAQLVRLMSKQWQQTTTKWRCLHGYALRQPYTNATTYRL